MRSSLPTIIDAPALIRGMGRWVRNTRYLLGISQDQLASFAQTSQGAISRLEAGRSLDTPLMTYLKTVTALCQEIAHYGKVVPIAPYVQVVLDFASYWNPVTGDLPPPLRDAEFSAFLTRYAALSPTARSAFLTLTAPLLEYLRWKDVEENNDGKEELHQGSDQEARSASQGPGRAAGQEDSR